MLSAPPPTPNPILNAYEQFVQDTPLVTRYVLTTLSLTWFSSFFFDLKYATATIPFYCLYRFEIYRIVISPLICQSILSLVFAYLSLLDSGKRLEFSMGSTAFGWYLLTIATVTNVVFCVGLFVLNGLTGEPGLMLYESVGIWTILFGLIATECSRAPRDSQRRLFFFNVPTFYFPLALWGLFSLMGGVNLADLLSVGVGYAYGHGLLDKLILSPSKFHAWEEGILANFTQRQGWVVGHAATGVDAWSTNANPSFSIFAPSQQQQQQQSQESSLPTDMASPGVIAPPSDPAFPSTGGRTLGSATQRRSAESEARNAMLAAAEKRASQKEEV